MDWVTATEGITCSKQETRLGGEKAGISFYTSMTSFQRKCETMRFPCSESLNDVIQLPQKDSGGEGAQEPSCPAPCSHRAGVLRLFCPKPVCLKGQSSSFKHAFKNLPHFKLYYEFKKPFKNEVFAIN